MLRSTHFIRLALAVVIPASVLRAQQVADTLFQPHVEAPAYQAGRGPVVLLDEAHHNFHTLAGRYLAFGRVVSRDGFVVQPNRERFTRESLGRVKILVIANALAERNIEDWELPTPSAFDSAEIATVRDWVKDGGSLLLIADHMPFPGAVMKLAEEFGVLVANGFALDEATEQDGTMRYSRASGRLGDHPITRGRSARERIDSVTAFTGQAFRLEGAGTPLMTLGKGTMLVFPQVAWQFSGLSPRMPAVGMLQGAALDIGRGRVAVFGEAAMFSAQVSGPERSPSGMNDPRAPQNAQFLLNVMHWLAGLI